MRLVLVLMIVGALVIPAVMSFTAHAGRVNQSLFSSEFDIRETDCGFPGGDDDDDDNGNALPGDVVFSVINNGNSPICEVALCRPGSGDDDDDDDNGGGGCNVTGCTPPSGWTCHVTPHGNAIYTANSANDCIQPGQTLGGFAFGTSGVAGDDDDDAASDCCFLVKVKDAAGALIDSRTHCFCLILPVTEKTWGEVKARYREEEE